MDEDSVIIANFERQIKKNKTSMKKSVEISAYSFAISIISLSVMAAVTYFSFVRGAAGFAWILIAMIMLICLFSLFYMPLSVEVDGKYLYVNRPLKVKAIRLDNIVEVKLCPPTMGARRISGSGGWFGYWGRYTEGDLGEYFAYYGKASDCFLVTLRDCRKYMLGCKDAPEMVEAIKKIIKS